MSCCEKTVSAVFDYGTVKTVHIKSRKVGLIFRTIQLAIVGYIVGYAIVYTKGYQVTEQAVSSTITKLKGTAVTCRDQVSNFTNCSLSAIRVWDTIDYSPMGQENSAFFVTSNSVEVPGQRQCEETWPEDPLSPTTGTSKAFACSSDDDCIKAKFQSSRNGAVAPTCNTSTGLCDIFGWGPVELSSEDSLSQQRGYKNQLDVRNFTVYIKNSVYFPGFNRRFGNLGRGNHSPAYIRNCLWAPHGEDYFCPVFRLDDVLKNANVKFDDGTNTSAMVAGAIIGINIKYDCDLDQGTTSCDPEYRFSRLDDAEQPSPGYNFRHAYYYDVTDPVFEGRNCTLRARSLSKIYGLRFVFTVAAQAGQFNFVPLLLTFGSGLGLLGLATVVSDFIVTKILARRSYYKSKKFEILDETMYDGFLSPSDRELLNGSKGFSSEAKPLLPA